MEEEILELLKNYIKGLMLINSASNYTVTRGERGAIIGLFNRLVGDETRYDVLAELFGKRSTKELNDDEWYALWKWTEIHKDEDFSLWVGAQEFYDQLNFLVEYIKGKKEHV